MNIWDEIKESFKRGSSLTQLIYINLGVFVILRLAYTFFALFSGNGLGSPENKIEYNYYVMQWLMLPSGPSQLLFRPWTLLTYMFLHFDFLHVLFNILWLYWFGKIFLQYLDNKRLLNLYLLGGVSGGVLFILAYNLIPALAVNGNVPLLGASAAVMAIAIAIAFYVPEYTIHLLFIGPVKLKYLALFFVITDLIFIPMGDNAGGHIAHLGGALYGIFFINRFKKGKDTGRWFGMIMDRVFSIFKPRPKIKVSYRKPVDDKEYNKLKKTQQDEIDKILDKISKGGYESLSREEKEKLFRMGK
jgi:membrane associated rhomboid family serine protease